MNRSTFPRPTPPSVPASLFDADRASSGDRAGITVGAVMRQDQVERAYAEAAYRLDVHTRYELALASGDEFAELAVLAEAARFDREHLSKTPLFDELHGMTLGLAA